MTDETSAPAGGEAIAADLPSDAPEAFSSASEAAAYFSGLVDKRKQPAAESAEQATADNELAQANDGPDDPAPAEEPEGDDPEAEKLPPIERPRSWSKDDDDDWNALPRTRQEKIAANERARETDINQRINKAAETAKAADAKAAQAEQARQSYEARQADYTKALETALQSDFGDIRTLEDVRNLQANDPFRFQAWQVRQMELSAAQAEKQQVDQRKASEANTKWTEHVQAEDAKFAEALSEADKAKITKLMAAAPEFLEDRGFTRQELTDMWNGRERLSLRDHRVQALILDGMKYRDIQKAPKAVAKPDLPPVVRPGSSRPSGQGANSERIQALNRKPELTVKEATELYTLQQRPSQRAS